MTCKAVKNQISQFLDQRLSQKDAEAFQLHMDACPACREELESMRAALGAFAVLERVEPRMGGWERLQDRLTDQHHSPAARWWQSFGWSKALAGAVTAAVVAVVVWQTTLSHQQPITVDRTETNQTDTLAVLVPDDNQAAPAPVGTPNKGDNAGADDVKPVPVKSAITKPETVKSAGSKRFIKRPAVAAKPLKPVHVPKVVVATSEPDPALSSGSDADSVQTASEVAQLVAEGLAPLVDAADYENSLYWASASGSEDWL